jgi:hypothetical protein
MACDLELGLQWEAIKRKVVNVDRRVSLREELHLALRLLPILEEEAMRHLLREALKARGWTEQEDGSLTKPMGDALARLSPDASEVTLSVEEEKTVSASARLLLNKRDDEQEAERLAKKSTKTTLDARANDAREQLAKKALAELARQEPELRAEVQQALNQTYRRALEERAKQLGELESLQERQESDGSYEVTVVVKA